MHFYTILAGRGAFQEPPGHHAGTGLKAMKATSNGFCLLNSAAAAAKYAATPLKEGGLGLKR